MITKHVQLAGTAIFCGLFAMGNSTFAQDTAFTYQGRLANASQPVTASYDMTFALFNAVTGGSQVGNTITVTAIGVTNGLFTVELDFGGNFPGADRWLEIGVRPAGGGAFTTLSPRQKFTATPYAITAGNLTGGLPAIQLSGTVPAAQVGSFTNHSDVVVSGLTAGQVLIYNGTVWTNGLLSASGSGPTPSNNIPVTLAYSGTNVPVNASLGTHFRLTATNNFLLQNPAGASDAQRMVFEIIQDATGGRTMVLGNAFKLGTDIPMVNLTTNAGRRDFLTCVCSGTNFYILGFIKGY
jgi:hypothetical protein